MNRVTVARKVYLLWLRMRVFCVQMENWDNARCSKAITKELARLDALAPGNYESRNIPEMMKDIRVMVKRAFRKI